MNKKIIVLFLALSLFIQGCVRANDCLLAQANAVAGWEGSCETK